MSEITIEGITRNTLSQEANYALDILVNLSLKEFNRIKTLLELDTPNKVGVTTLEKFLTLCKELGFNLSETGVNQFKDKHNLGNSGVVKGIIGPQTSEFYLKEIDQKLTPKIDENGINRQINKAGLDLVKEFEGLYQLLPSGMVKAYLDPVRVPTIGWGHTEGVKMGDIITIQEAENYLSKDLKNFEAAVSKLVKVSLGDNEFSALVSFTFNLGIGALAQSTLLKHLNNDKRQQAANEFLRWVKAGGTVLPGLVRRREAEKKLFLTA